MKSKRLFYLDGFWKWHLSWDQRDRDTWEGLIQAEEKENTEARDGDDHVVFEGKKEIHCGQRVVNRVGSNTGEVSELGLG